MQATTTSRRIRSVGRRRSIKDQATAKNGSKSRARLPQTLTRQERDSLEYFSKAFVRARSRGDRAEQNYIIAAIRELLTVWNQMDFDAPVNTSR